LPDIFEIKYFGDTKENWENSYNFSFEKDIYSLLKNNQSLLLLFPKSSDYSLSWQDYHFCLLISDNQTNSSKISQIEQIAKNIFAKNFPSEEIARLPDNSTITELVSKPEVFEFQAKKIANVSIKYLQKPNLEFGYVSFREKIIFSDSISFLEQMIIKNINQKTFITDCFGEENVPADFIYFSPDTEFENEYGIKKLLITNKKACIY